MKYIGKTNATDGAYIQSVNATRGYETDGRNSRRDAINTMYHVLTGRNFSEYLQWRGWNIQEVARLQMTRFSLGGESDIIGRDILNYSDIENEIIRDSVYLAWKNGGAIQVEFTDKQGNNQTLIVWRVMTGKRTWHGMADNGQGHERIKVHYQPKHKRNRKLLGF